MIRNHCEGFAASNPLLSCRPKDELCFSGGPGCGAPVKEGSWGYRLLVVDDPDGNQLFFNYPAETASGKTAGDAA